MEKVKNFYKKHLTKLLVYADIVLLTLVAISAYTGNLNMAIIGLAIYFMGEPVRRLK